MSSTNLGTEVVNRLHANQKTVSELASDLGVSEQETAESVKILVDQGILGRSDDSIFVIRRNLKESDISNLEWAIIELMRNRKGSPIKLGELTRRLGEEDVTTAVNKLEAAEILIRTRLGGYRMPKSSETKIPLQPEEKSLLLNIEGRIDDAMEDVERLKLQIATDLRLIRDQKLYRENHNRFEDYVNDRFERTRDWAYKCIAELEVRESLEEVKKTARVEAIIQSVKSREIQHLSRLKRQPDQMIEALKLAERTAKKGKRSRMPEDVKAAVSSIVGAAEPAIAPSLSSRKVDFVGVKYESRETTDLSACLSEFAKWFRRNPTDSKFAIEVGPATIRESGDDN